MADFKQVRSWAALAVLGLVAASAQAADVKIGVAAALTGGAAQYGQAIRQGFELAAEQINAAGGIHGDAIVLLVEDDQGKKDEAINTFKKLIHKDKVLAVFGPTLSSSASAAHPIAQQAKTVAFGTSLTVDGITQVGDYVFRNSVTEAVVLPETLRKAVAATGTRKVAVIYGNDDVLTKNGYENFKKALDDQKIAITTTETYAKGDVDFKAQLTKIKASEPDAIVISTLIAEGGPIVAQARQLGITQPFIGGNGLNTPRLFELAGERSDNVWVGGPWSSSNDTPQNQQFIQSYQAKYGKQPDQFAAQAFDAMHILAKGLQQAKPSGDVNKDRAALREALPHVTHTGATGAFRFQQATDKRGKPAGFDAVQTPVVTLTQNQQYVVQK